MASMIKRASKSHSNIFGKYEAIDEEQGELNPGVLRNDRKEQKQSKNIKTKKARPKSSMFHSSVEANERDKCYGSYQRIDIDARPTFHLWQDLSNITEDSHQTSLKEIQHYDTPIGIDDATEIKHAELEDQTGDEQNFGLPLQRVVEGASRENLGALPKHHPVLTRETSTQMSRKWAQSMGNLAGQGRDNPYVTYIKNPTKCIIPTGGGDGRQSSTLIANTSNGDSELSENIRSTVLKRTRNSIKEFKELEVGPETKSQIDARMLLTNNKQKLVIFQGDPDDTHIEALKLIASLKDTGNLMETHDLPLHMEERNQTSRTPTDQAMKVLKESIDPTITATANAESTNTRKGSTVGDESVIKDESQEKDTTKTEHEREGKENNDVKTDDSENEIFILNDPNECYHIEVDNSIIYIPEASGTTHFDNQKLASWIGCIKQNILAVAGSTVQIIMTVNTFQDVRTLCIPRKYEYCVINLASNEYRINDAFKVQLLDGLVKKHEVTLCHKLTSSLTQESDKYERLSFTDKDNIVANSEIRCFVKRANDFFKENLHRGKDFFLDARPDIIKEIEDMTLEQQFTLLVVNAFQKLSPANIERLEQIQIVKDKNWLSMSMRNMSQTNQIEVIDVTKDKHLAKLDIVPDKCKALFQFALEHNLQYNMGKTIKTVLPGLELCYYVSKTDNVYTLSGTAIKHSLQIHISKMYPYEELASCDEDFLSKYVLSPQENTNKLGVHIERNDEKTINAIIDRFKDEILKGKVKQISNHELMKQCWFVDKFMTHKSSKHKSLWNILKQIDTCSDEPYTLLVFGVLIELDDETFGSVVSLAEKIMINSKWQEKRKKNKLDSEPQEEEALLLAAKLGKANIFNTLVQKGASVPSKALENAIQARCLEIVYSILERRKCVNNHKIFVDTCRLVKGALEIAAKHHQCSASIAIFELLADKVGLDYQNSSIENLIHFAARKGDCKMLTILKKAAGSKKRSLYLDLDLVSKSGETALTIALKEHHLEFANMILDLSASQRKLPRMNQLPIGIAAELGQVDMVRRFVKTCPLTCKENDAFGRTPLHVAVMNGHTEVVAILLEIPSVPFDDKDDNCKTPLEIATDNGHEEIVSLLKAKMQK